jgi:hypothetical protein
MEMDTAQIRHQNFLALFKAFRDQHSNLPDRGMLKLFAEKLELSDRYLSHIKNNRKNIGANIARKIEQRLKLPHGWMDNLHSNTVRPDGSAESQFVQTALSLYRENPVEAQAMMLEFLQKRLTPTKR